MTALDATGPALGLFAEARFEETTLALERGNTLALFTDGVYEALDADDLEFGTARVAALLATMSTASAAEQAAALLDAVRRHRGSRQGQDDVTVMVIRAI